MTLGQLRRELARHLGLDTTTSDGLVAFWDRDLLNEAASLLSLELNIPRATLVANGSDYTGQDEMTITLPDGAKVLSVYATPDILVPVLESNEVAYTTDKLPFPARNGYVAVSGTNAITLLKPKWKEWPDMVKVNYSYPSPEMVNETDEPWDGQYAPYHRLIALRAAMEALLRLDPGEPETNVRYAGVQKTYESLKERFVEQELSQSITLNNAVLLLYPRTRRWA